ncbi:MAG: nucleotide pyrophosphohydrolase [Chloroflexi bacterium]|nr:nucleotide pyrophosphohydrolase [Chloroflexota bacterium]
MTQSNSISDRETSVEQLKARVQEFVDQREWRKYHKPKNLAMSIAIEAAELMELFQWADENESDAIIQEKLPSLEDELADIMVYCLSMANTVNIDISRAIVRKIAKNEHKYPVEQFKGVYKKPDKDVP